MRKLACLVLVLAACGDDDPVRHLDGGTSDTPPMIDAPMTQAVTLTITVAGQPQADVKVYFQNGDSSLISNTKTDASGVATALMPNGGFVTAVDPYDVPVPAFGGPPTEFHQLYTFAGVKPGDDLVLKDARSGVTDVTITAPVDGTAGVTNYLFSTPCDVTTIGAPGSAAQPQATLSLDDACATTTDFLVASLDGGDQVVNWFYVPNQAVTATLDLTASTYAAATAKSYTFNNANGLESSVNVDQIFASPRGKVVTLSDTAFGKGSPFTATIPVTNVPGTIDIVSASGQVGSTLHYMLDWGAFSTTYTTDVGARLLTQFDAPVVDTTAHTVGWTESTPAVAPDFAAALVGANRTGLSWQWEIVAPYAGATVPMPTLPTDVADFTIVETDSAEFFGVALGKVPGGYDAIRAKLFSMLDSEGPEALATGASGAITLELWQMPRLARELPRSKQVGARPATWIDRDRLHRAPARK